ncbi:outer membrane transport energization protein TonB [bacterium A37T11]|nr:outer membrane transport energization protein TonB [bacterium A37T11]
MRYYHIKEENNFPRALWISGGIMAAFLLISFFIYLGSPVPEFGTGGIVVNYGTSAEGMGNDYMSTEEPSMDPNANQTKPDRVEPELEPEKVTSHQESDKSVVTQDVEDAPAVETKEKKTNSAPVTTTPKKESKPTLNPNALYGGKKNNGTGTGDGTGNTPGNQGSKDGSNMASNYGEGGSGNGLIGMPNRSFTVRPQVDDNGRQSGKVAVEVMVNKDGVVTSARPGVKGTTLPDANLWEKCRQAAMASRFNSLGQGPDVMKGIIVFNFKVK